MPRRNAAKLREVQPDGVYNNRLVQQLINKVMLDGKTSTAERIGYGAAETLGQERGKEPVEALEAAIKALTPNVEVKSRRVGGASYQVPIEVPGRRARTLAIRWLVEAARARREKTMQDRLAFELLDAQTDQGAAFKKKEDIFRMAQANRAFSHYRW